MYAISLVFLLAAVVTLAIGFVQGGLALVFVSIGASVASALFLAVGVLRRRPLQPATAGAPFGPEEGTAAAAAATRPPARGRPAGTVPPRRRPATGRPAARPAEPAAPETVGAPRPVPRKPAAKRPARKPAAAKVSSAKAAAPGTGQVVSLPERGTYHQASCRFVKGRRDTERITMATAKRRGYTACGVCKPG